MIKNNEMLKLRILIWTYIILHAIWGDAFAADPLIRSIDLKTFGNDVAEIGALYNSTTYVVGKCCPIGQLLRPAENEEDAAMGPETFCGNPLATETIEYSPVFTDFNETGMMIPGEKRERFIAVVGIPCRNQVFELAPEVESRDEYYLLSNGSLVMPYSNPSILAPGADYCMDYVAGRGLVVLQCYEPELTVVTADTRLAFYAVGLLTSVPFLLMTIISYLITRELRDVYGMTLCCYSGCLATAFLTLAILQLAGHTFKGNDCDSVAFVIQFSFIACFFWLNAMTVEMWLLVSRYREVGAAIENGRPKPNSVFFYYSLWAWGVPAFLVILTICLSLAPTIPWNYVKQSVESSPYCWSEPKSARPDFYVPVGFLVFANAALFSIAGVRIAQTQRDLDIRRLARNAESDRNDRRVFKELRLTFVTTLVLYLIMAINWSMELVSVLMGNDMLAWSVFDLVNALQGVLVFGLFVLRKPERMLVWRRVKSFIGIGDDRDSTEDRLHELTLLPVHNNLDTTLPLSRIRTQ